MAVVDGKLGLDGGAAPGGVDTVGGGERWGDVILTISNSVLPLEKLCPTPSSLDGMSQVVEDDLRNLGCNLIQTAGKLLRLPQVAMATGCVLFQRFFFAKSFVRYPMEVVAMGCVCLACKIEEAHPARRVRDVINVFNHIKQVRQGKPIKPVILDSDYISLKNNVIKAERRVLKELGFCVHIKHPHKLVVMYMQFLEAEADEKFVQMSWNFMNDSLRTDAFVRYQPETIACACIYLSARKLNIPLPKKPAWYTVLGVEQDDIKDCCYRIICLYQRSKPVQEDLEKDVDSLKAQLDESRKLARGVTNTAVDSPASQPCSPVRQNEKNGEEGKRVSDGEGRERSRSKSHDRRRRKKNRRDRSHSGSDREIKRDKSRKSKKRERSWSHSPIYKGRKGGRSRSRERFSSHHMSHDRFDKNDLKTDRSYDKGDRNDRVHDKGDRNKYDHKGYQDKYKKGDRIERDHYRR